MGASWVRVDVDLPDKGAVADGPPLTDLVLISLIQASKRHDWTFGERRGFVPREDGEPRRVLRRLRFEGLPDLEARAIAALEYLLHPKEPHGLLTWDESAQGWWITDWTRYQPDPRGAGRDRERRTDGDGPAVTQPADTSASSAASPTPPAGPAGGRRARGEHPGSRGATRLAPGTTSLSQDVPGTNRMSPPRDVTGRDGTEPPPLPSPAGEGGGPPASPSSKLSVAPLTAGERAAAAVVAAALERGDVHLDPDEVVRAIDVEIAAADVAARRAMRARDANALCAAERQRDELKSRRADLARMRRTAAVTLLRAGDGSARPVLERWQVADDLSGPKDHRVPLRVACLAVKHDARADERALHRGSRAAATQFVGRR